MASRKIRFLLVLLGVVFLAVGAFLRWDRQRSIQDIRTAKVERQDIHAGVVTNGKAEPIDYRDVRAEIDGEVLAVSVHDWGDPVRQGQKLMEISPAEVSSALSHARAELAEAQDALRLLKKGGTASEVSELSSQAELARQERDQAAKQVTENERLVEKGAVSKIDLQQSRNRLSKAEADLSILNQKLDHRYDPEQIAEAESRIQADQAAVNLAEAHLRAASVVAPLSGIAYSVALRPGDYVRTGDLLARVGDFRRIRVRVYVDEPDLGKVAKSQPVLVSWDGLPDKQWRGQVDRLPSEIEDLGTRKVGEVSCILDNPELQLLPNMSLNVEIVTESKPQVLTVPREALLGSGKNQYVFLVRDGTLVKQPVQTGTFNPVRIEIRQGLQEGDEVALAGETPLREGMRVRTGIG